MKGKIVVFRLPPRTYNTEISKFCQRFYGQNTSSHQGKYIYRRKGLLEEIPHIKLIRGALIVLENDIETIVNFLEAYNAEIHVRTIKLTTDDEKNLLGPID